MAHNDIGDVLLELGGRIGKTIEDLFPVGTDEDFLTTPFWHHMGTGGKRIRPALCLLTCRELGGDEDDAMNFAAAVEILHNMFLVHDDLEDGDRIRRDAPTVWVKYGKANAINLGDYMIGRAYSVILASPVDNRIKLKLLDIFTHTYETTCRGQALDLNRRGSADFNVKKYMEIVQKKTADYLVLGMLGGAVVAGVPAEVLDALKHLGSLMGPAFQIRDDIIDLTLGKGRGGELGNDIKEGKPSILFAHALSNASEKQKKSLLKIVRKKREKTNEKDLKTVLQIYESCGSIDFAGSQAEQLTDKAYKAVENIPVENKEVFRNIVHFMSERTK